MSFYTEEVAQLRADLESAQRLNIDLAKIFLGLAGKQAVVQVQVSPDQAVLFKEGVESFLKQATRTACAQLVRLMEEGLQTRASLYREIAELKFRTREPGPFRL